MNFADPWGLKFEMTKEDYVKLNTLAKVIFDNKNLDLSFNEQGDSIVLDASTWDYDDIDTGSETGKALLKSLICSDSTVSLSFIYDENKQLSDSLGEVNRITMVNVDLDKLDFEENESQESKRLKEAYTLTFIHESAHTYSLQFGIMSDLNVYCANRLYNVDFAKKHGEAIAITVEERFRNEMGYSPRDSKYGIIGGEMDYGAWVYNLPCKVLWQKDDSQIRHRPDTLRNTVFIWEDVINTAGGIK